jgi:hypothetical protein
VSTSLDNGRRSPRKLLRAVVARCSGGSRKKTKEVKTNDGQEHA